MASSITSPALQLAADKALVVSKGTIAKTKYFTTNFSDEVIRPMTTLEVAVYDGKASTFDKTTNDYGTIDGSVTYRPVSFDKHFKSTFGFEDLDSVRVPTNQFWTNAGEAAGRALGRTIEQEIGVALLGSDPAGEIAADADLTFENVAKAVINALAKNDLEASRTTLVLNAPAYGKLISILPANLYGDGSVVKSGMIEGLFGLKGVIQLRDLTTASGGTGPAGVLVQEDAVIVAARAIPVGSPAMYQEVGQTVDDDSGLPMGIRIFGDAKKGVNYFNMEVLLGVNVKFGKGYTARVIDID